MKCKKLKEVAELAKSIGLVTGKSWQHSRDTLLSEKEDVGD